MHLHLELIRSPACQKTRFWSFQCAPSKHMMMTYLKEMLSKTYFKLDRKYLELQKCRQVGQDEREQTDQLETETADVQMCAAGR